MANTESGLGEVEGMAVNSAIDLGMSEFSDKGEEVPRDVLLVSRLVNSIANRVEM
jgi:tRNA A-37 threonylcarbamoyl transferase component Bud32